MKAIITGLMMVTICFDLARATDWPNWRGPARDGMTPETGWFKDGATSKVVWEGNVGAGYSGVVIQGGRLYTAGNRDGKDVVVCLDPKTGGVLWQYEYPCKAGDFPGPRSTPAVDEASVYFMSRVGQVHCIDSAKGTLKWKRDVGAEMAVEFPKWGLAGSPVVEGGLLLIAVGPRGMVMDKKTGATKWDSGGKECGYASPVLTGAGSGQTLIMFGAKAVSASELMTGRKLWEFPWNTSWDVNAADPVVMEGKMFITSGYGRGGALLDVSGKEPVLLWENKNIASHFFTPVVKDGYLYCGHGNTKSGMIRCLDIKSGAVQWEYSEVGYGSMVLADGKLLILGDTGTLAIAEATPRQYRSLWQGKVLGDTCWTVPTLCNGLIYCRNNKGRLLCLDLKGP